MNEPPPAAVIGLAYLRWGVFLGCWTMVLWGMYSPGAQVPGTVPGGDKLIHALALLAMAFTARWALLGPSGRIFWPGMLILGVGLECLQPVIQPSRSFSVMDIAANLSGVCLALVCWRYRPSGVQLLAWVRQG